MDKYQKTFKEAKEVYKERTGVDWNTPDDHDSTVTIYHLKHGRNKGKYFVGSHFQWLNLT